MACKYMDTSAATMMQKIWEARRDQTLLSHISMASATG